MSVPRERISRPCTARYLTYDMRAVIWSALWRTKAAIAEGQFH